MRRITFPGAYPLTFSARRRRRLAADRPGLAAREARARVRCRGRLHTVLVTPSGRLALPHHSAEEVRRQLAQGGDVCRCALVLLAWRGVVTGAGDWRPRLPRGLFEAARAARARGSWRAYFRARQPADVLTLGPCGCRPGFLGRLLTRLVRRRFPGLQAPLCRVVYTQFGVAADAYRLVLLSGRRLLLRGTIRRDWLASVYRRGLAGYGGGLVLGAGPDGRRPHADVVLDRHVPDGADGGLVFSPSPVALVRQPDGSYHTAPVAFEREESPAGGATLHGGRG
jgi:hypothetical protein